MSGFGRTGDRGFLDLYFRLWPRAVFVVGTPKQPLGNPGQISRSPCAGLNSLNRPEANLQAID
jgi:hypothetical protein